MNLSSSVPSLQAISMQPTTVLSVLNCPGPTLLTTCFSTQSLLTLADSCLGLECRADSQGGFDGGGGCSDGGPSQCPQVQGPEGVEGDCNGNPTPCVPLNNAALILWWPWFFLHFPSCGAPYSHHFRLPCHSQQLPLPWVCSPNPTFQHPDPSTPGDTQLSLGCTGCSMDHAHRSHSVLPSTDQLLHSPLSPWNSFWVPADFPNWEVRGFLCVQELLLTFGSPPGVLVPSHFLFSFFLSFILPGCVGIFLVLLDVWGLLLVFSKSSVRIVPFVDVFLMYLWGEANSTSSYSAILTPPPIILFLIAVQLQSNWNLIAEV